MAEKTTVTPISTAFVLPTKKSPPLRKSPKNLVIFSKPKVGKTSLLAQLDNCLILDLENGTDYLEAMSTPIKSIADLRKVGDAIITAGKPYKYLAVDTISALEDLCIPFAEEIYSKTPMGKNWYTDGKLKYGTIINMPTGSGYAWLREAFTRAVDYIKTLAPNVILVGHIKDTMLEKDGSEFNSLDLDLTGKLKRMTTANSDAIGYLYRKKNTNILSFKTTDEVLCGARPEHLRNEEIVVSEVVDGKVVTYWDRIFVD